MKILTLGSLNFDFVYSVNHISLKGETVSAYDLELKHGGKGLNQAVALAKATADVSIVGCIGPDGDALVETLRSAGVKTDLLKRSDERSGHAIIQVDENGANSIVIFGGANEKITPEMIHEALGKFHAGDYLLMQNEVSNVDYAMRAAKKCGIKVAFNPSPITDKLLGYPLELVDLFILNEIEGQILSQLPSASNCKKILATLAKKFPAAAIVMTMGGDGVMYHDSQLDIVRSAYNAPVVDTTGAGDTFCGYFLACTMMGMNAEQALDTASKASALAIGKKGAAVSIPKFAEVLSAKFDSK